jgi:integrase
MAAKVDAELLERSTFDCSGVERCAEGAVAAGTSVGTSAAAPCACGTQGRVHFILSASLERTVRWRHLGVNEAALAGAPSPQQTDADPPTAAEAAAILTEAWSTDPD